MKAAAAIIFSLLLGVAGYFAVKSARPSEAAAKPALPKEARGKDDLGAGGSEPLAASLEDQPPRSPADEPAAPSADSASSSDVHDEPASDPNPRDPIADLEYQVRTLKQEILHLQLQLDLCGSGAHGAIGLWLASLPPEEADRWRKTEPELLRNTGLTLQGFPILLFDPEMRWVLERVRLDDWENYGGPSPIQVLIEFLGPERLKRELDEKSLAELQFWYPEYW